MSRGGNVFSVTHHPSDPFLSLRQAQVCEHACPTKLNGSCTQLTNSKKWPEICFYFILSLFPFFFGGGEGGREKEMAFIVS